MPALVWKLAKLSASAALQMLIGMASWIGLIRIISGFGTDAVAGYLIGYSRNYLRPFAFGRTEQHSGDFSSVNRLARGNPERAEKAVWQAAFAAPDF